MIAASTWQTRRGDFWVSPGGDAAAPPRQELPGEFTTFDFLEGIPAPFNFGLSILLNQPLGQWLGQWLLNQMLNQMYKYLGADGVGPFSLVR